MTPGLPPHATSVLLLVPDRLRWLVSTCEEWTLHELRAGRFDALQVSVSGETDGPRVKLSESGHPSSWRLQQSVLRRQTTDHNELYSYSSADWWPEHWVCRPMRRDTFGEMMVQAWLHVRAIFPDPESSSAFDRRCYEEPPTSNSGQLYWNDPDIITSPNANGAADIKDHKDMTAATSDDANSQMPNSPVITITTGGSSPMDFYYYNNERQHLHVSLPAVRLGPFTIWIWFPQDDRLFRHAAFFPRPVAAYRGYRLIFVMRWLTRQREYAKEFPHYMKPNAKEQAQKAKREATAAARATEVWERSEDAAQERKRTQLAQEGIPRTRARLDATTDPEAPEANPRHRAARPVGTLREAKVKR